MHTTKIIKNKYDPTDFVNIIKNNLQKNFVILKSDVIEFGNYSHKRYFYLNFNATELILKFKNKRFPLFIVSNGDVYYFDSFKFLKMELKSADENKIYCRGTVKKYKHEFNYTWTYADMIDHGRAFPKRKINIDYVRMNMNQFKQITRGLKLKNLINAI